MTRTLEEIEIQIANALIQSGSPANDLTAGSVLSTLIRSLAAPHVVTDNLLYDVTQRLNLQIARGADLDSLAANLGIFRKQSSTSRGFVLVQALDSSTIIRPGVDFTELTSGLQFVADIEQPIEVAIGIETVIPIVSVLRGSDANLPAGTLLTPTTTSLNPLNLQVTVGSSRMGNGKYCGDLSGGLDRESDLTFRQRIIAVISTKDSNSLETIRQKALALNSVQSAWVYTKSPGTVEVLVQGVSPLSTEQIASIRNLLQPYVAAGVFMMVVESRPNLLDVTVEVTPRPNDNITELQTLIKATIVNYFHTLETNKQPTTTSLASRIRPLVLSVSVDFPNAAQQINLTYNAAEGEYLSPPVLTYSLGNFKLYFR